MNDRQILELTEWVTEAGLAGASETALVDGFCRRLVEYGVPLTRVAALIDTLHPVLEARTFHWHRTKNETEAIDYARSTARESQEKWLSSPFHYLFVARQSKPCSLRQSGLTDACECRPA
jgi:adenylate cyclase